MRLQVVIIGDAPHKPKANNTNPIATFLEITPPTLSLEDLAERISGRYTRLYPQNRPLNIQRLQDSEGNDLDLAYIVGDVFDDKSNNRETSIVRVIHKDLLRDDSVPPESGLRPSSTKKRSIQTLSTVEEIEAADEESIGVPVPNRNKRQRLDTAESDENESEDVGSPKGKPEGAGSRPSEVILENQAAAAAESSNAGLGLRSPSLGPGFGSAMMNHDTLIPSSDFVENGQPERSSSMLAETSQAVAELLSPKEESFSSPVFTATTPKTALSSQPVELSSEVTDLDTPLIAPQAVKGTRGRPVAKKTSPGSLKRPTRALTNNKSTSHRSSDIYEVEDSEQSSSDDAAEKPAAKKQVSRAAKKPPASVSKRIIGRRSTVSATPTVEVPSSQSEQSITRTSNFVIEVPHVEDLIGSERRPSASGVPHIEDLLGSKKKPAEVGKSNTTSKKSPPSKSQKNTARPGRKGSKQPETPAASTSTSAALTVPKFTPRSITPQSITSEGSDTNNGKQLSASSILQSALRNPGKNYDAKKSVSFANEGSPTPAARPAAAGAESAATKEQKEIRKPKTTFKVPTPNIPPELVGIGDRSTAEARKKMEAFTEKPARRRSTASRSPVRNGASVQTSGQNKSVSPSSLESGSGENDDKTAATKAGKPAPSQSQKPTRSQKTRSSTSAEPLEDEVMKDAPPLSTTLASPTSLSSLEDESSRSESDSESPDDTQDSKGKSKKVAAVNEVDASASGASDSSESESEDSDSDQEIQQTAASASDDEDYEESGPLRHMTREESPVKGPGKRLLRSLSPEKKDFYRISYDMPSRLAVEPVKKSTPADGDSDEESDESEEPATSKLPQPSKKSPAKMIPYESDEESSESESVKDSGDKASASASASESENESASPKLVVPSSSISMVPESPPAVKSQSKTQNVADESEETNDSTATSTSSESESESSEEDEDEDEDVDEEKEKTPEPTKTDKNARAVENLFRRERESSAATASPGKPKLANGNHPVVSRSSNTPEVSQPSGPSKLPHSRMNRRTLGYISPSPGPPSSMPARLPSMVQPKDTKKRYSLNTHYKGLSALSQQDIPETREGLGRATGKPSASQSSKASQSEKMKEFQNMLSGQGVDESEDDDSEGDESSDSSGGEEEDASKQANGNATKSKGYGFKSFLGLL